MATKDPVDDLSALSKSELRALLRRSQKRLSRVKSRQSANVTVASGDARVQNIADEIRSLAKAQKMRRREVFALVAGAMRIKIVPDGQGRGAAKKGSRD